MLQADLIDELVIYVAPKLLGDRARALFDLREALALDQAVNLIIEDMRAVGEDWRVTARVRPRGDG
jgi:diaminohydroxyphosphoribosylaminopyrimidine deaminase/5-amino-6-(5-phosphoribosylamino)uracil reductase